MFDPLEILTCFNKWGTALSFDEIMILLNTQDFNIPMFDACSIGECFSSNPQQMFDVEHHGVGHGSQN